MPRNGRPQHHSPPSTRGVVRMPRNGRPQQHSPPPTPTPTPLPQSPTPLPQSPAATTQTSLPHDALAEAHWTALGQQVVELVEKARRACPVPVAHPAGYSKEPVQRHAPQARVPGGGHDDAWGEAERKTRTSVLAGGWRIPSSLRTQQRLKSTPTIWPPAASKRKSGAAGSQREGKKVEEPVCVSRCGYSVPTWQLTPSVNCCSTIRVATAVSRPSRVTCTRKDGECTLGSRGRDFSSDLVSLDWVCLD